MLTREDVEPITKYFHESPDDDIFEDAIRYTAQFATEKSMVRFCAGISAVAFYTGDWYYRQLSQALYGIGLSKGYDVYDLMPWHVPGERLRDSTYSVRQVSEIVPRLQEDGLRVGFLHGHYRIVTPANLANILIASEKCDKLILGFEDGWRTLFFKKAPPLVRDWQRWQWILSSGFDGYVCRISRFSYDNKSYERIMKRINPDIYFGNASIPTDILTTMEQRAEANGVEFVVLPEQLGFHSSAFLADRYGVASND